MNVVELKARIPQIKAINELYIGVIRVL